MIKDNSRDVDVEQLKSNGDEEEGAVEVPKPFTNSAFSNFIQKYHLNGAVSSVKWQIKDGQVACFFVSKDSSLIGNVVYKNFPLPDSEIAIYETKKLIKLLRVLDDNIDLKIETRGVEKTPVLMKIWDERKDVHFRLSEHPDIIPSARINQMPEWQVEFKLTEQFGNDFTSAEGAIKDIDSTAFISDDQGALEIIVGYSDGYNTNRVYLQLAQDELQTASQLCPADGSNYLLFRSSHIREIINANSDMVNGMVRISEEGVMQISFEHEEDMYDTTYYLLAIEE